MKIRQIKIVDRGMVGRDAMTEALNVDMYMVEFLRLKDLFAPEEDSETYLDNITVELLGSEKYANLVFRGDVLQSIDVWGGKSKMYMLMDTNFWDEVINETYSELYASSTPSANFNELVENATINRYGEKEIPYNEYGIEREKYDAIIDRKIKKFNITGEQKDKYKRTILLGCSPKFKNNKAKIL